jgi:hypothetical protein
MNKNIKKLIKQINKEKCIKTINSLTLLLDIEISTAYNKTKGSLSSREDYENNIYSKLRSKV